MFAVFFPRRAEARVQLAFLEPDHDRSRRQRKGEQRKARQRARAQRKAEHGAEVAEVQRVAHQAMHAEGDQYSRFALRLQLMPPDRRRNDSSRAALTYMNTETAHSSGAITQVPALW